MSIHSTDLPAAEHSGTAPHVPRILFVDDDDTIRQTVVRYAALRGYRIEAFREGRKALQSLKAETCDLLITDLHMPEVDGIEIICAARKLNPRMSIIAVSGGDSYEFNHLHTAHLLGAKHTLKKPFVLSELIELIQSALESRG